MSAPRSFLRAGKMVSMASRAAPARGNLLSAQARMSFSFSTKKPDYEPIHNKEVPTTTFTPGAGVEHSTLVVDGIPAPDASATVDSLTPMTQEAYDQLSHSMKQMSVFGKVIIITGAARGLGNNMARACIEAGAKAIVIFDANQKMGDEAAAELYNLTGRTVPISFAKVDVRDGDAIQKAVDAVVADFGTPDVLINSAGIADSNIPLENYDHHMFRRLIDINLTGSFLMTQIVGKAMMAAGKPGSIVLVASMSGSIVNYPQEQSCYNASKAGVAHFGKSAAAEWAKYNIRVNMISPGYMDTALNNVPALDAQKVIWKGMTPQARLGAVDDLNGLAVFLASDSSKFMTGANVLIDGGYSLY